MKILAIAATVFLVAHPALADFNLKVSGWGDIPYCYDGSPNVVGNPQMVIEDLPAGTNKVDIQLKDLDAPNYKHGGKVLRISSGGAIAAGTFKYKSPCPPGTPHTYEWIAIARKGGKELARATVRMRYPQ